MKNYFLGLAFVISFQLLKLQKLKVVYMFIKIQENKKLAQNLRPQREKNYQNPTKPKQTNKKIITIIKAQTRNHSFFPL